MKNIKKLVWISPLALLIAGCAAPVKTDTTISEWQSEGVLPPSGRGTSISEFERGGRLLPTGRDTQNVYTQPQSYAAATALEPRIIIETESRDNRAADLALADAIRDRLEYDRGLAPTLERVIISVQNGRVTLQGMVRSDLDARVTVDSLRDVVGVTRIKDDLAINPNWD
jgi:hypothetical protein